MREPHTRRRPQPRGGPGRRRFGFLPGRELPGRDDRAPGLPLPKRRPLSPARPPGDGPSSDGPSSGCLPPECLAPARRPSAGRTPVSGRPPVDRRPPCAPLPPEPGPLEEVCRGGIDSPSCPGSCSSATPEVVRPGTDPKPPRPGFPRRFCWVPPPSAGTSRRDFGWVVGPAGPPREGPPVAALPANRPAQGVRPRRPPRSRSIRSTMSTGSAITWCRYSPVIGCSKPSSAACRATRGAPLSSGSGVPGNFPR